MGGLDLLNTPIQLTLELFIARKFNNLSEVIFYSKKNHNFFVKQVMKTMVLPLNGKHFGVYAMKNSFQNYERFSVQRAKSKPSD